MDLCKPLLIAIVFALGATTAQATTYALTDSPGTAPTLLAVGDIASTQNPVDYSPPDDSFYFNLAISTPVSLFLATYGGVTGFTAHLALCNDASCTSQGSDIVAFGEGAKGTANLSAGLYRLFVDGSPPAHSYYVAYAKAVPVPAAAWLLVSGLAGLGVLARRRTEGAKAAIA